MKQFSPGECDAVSDFLLRLPRRGVRRGSFREHSRLTEPDLRKLEAKLLS
jgi:hypothetical protein